MSGGEESAEPKDMARYDRWLTWKHGAQSRDRALRPRNGTEKRTNVAALDWGNQALLESSLALIAPSAPEVITHFYDDLFTRVPGLRQLFPADLSVQKDRLLAALLALVGGGANPATLVPVLEQLGRDHRKFGARRAQYGAVGEALIAALGRFAGPSWTPAVEQAWRARYVAAAAVMIQAAEDGDSQPPFWYATVVGHNVYGRDVAILRVRPHQPYRYVAGQYATLESPRLPRVWRPYSMATVPRPDQLLEFHVRAIGRGGLSDALLAASPGDVVRVGPPQGSVVLRDSTRRPVLFVAGGTGWSTVKALLGQQARDYDHLPSRLLVSCRPGEPYDPGFEQFVRALPNVGTTLIHSPNDLRAELAPDRLPGNDLDAFVAGPAGLVDSATRLLDTAGIPPAHIHHDLLPT
jgi:ferredoxin-NADP reductase/hemoglobin-like flavoprotein